ncbi:MAG: hypothetical protein AB7O65_14420, partial [Candidatus Korobacteraceae bacterium]
WYLSAWSLSNDYSVSWPFSFVWLRLPPVELSIFQDPFKFLLVLLIVGLILDLLYIQIQRFHWDQDWPFAYQFFFSWVEFFIVFFAMDLGLLDFLFPEARIPFSTAVTHFSWVFFFSFIGVLALVQIFFVRWRFKGGELGRFPLR